MILTFLSIQFVSIFVLMFSLLHSILLKAMSIYEFMINYAMNLVF